MDKGFISILMEDDMKGSGLRINSLVQVRKPGLMVQSMKVNTAMAKSMAMVSSNGSMDQFIKEISREIILKAKEVILGAIREIILDPGNLTKCTVEAYFSGLMAGDMKANMLMTRRKGKEFSPGLMDASMMEAGRTASSMVLAVISQLMGRRDKENGTMEPELIGSINLIF